MGGVASWTYNGTTRQREDWNWTARILPYMEATAADAGYTKADGKHKVIVTKRIESGKGYVSPIEMLYSKASAAKDYIPSRNRR